MLRVLNTLGDTGPEAPPQPQIAGSTIFLSIRSSVLEAAQDAKGVFAAACKPTFSAAKQ